MAIDRQAVLDRLRAFDFSALFTQELGWDWYTADAKITVGKANLTLKGIAEKRGVHVFHCPAGADGRLPDASLCAAIERQAAKIAREHLLIFTDAAHTEQIWLYPRRQPGKPARLVRYRFEPGKANELLLQKLSAITFTLNEEEGLNLLGVVERLKDALDRDVVTKAFYQRFEKERAAFQKFLEGIPDTNLERWYVAVMMNRLMFIYFIQEKKFLGGGDQRYLQNHLAGFNGNYYKDFLCPLFFEGFALQPHERSAKTTALLGPVPYLNGGIFQQHEIETVHGRTIAVPNEAFARLFKFFDEWRWHLDERPIASGTEINPEILGYIFEKFINQKQMGAYYTKEDITGYISRNTILPHLLDAARAKCKVAFENPGGPTVWDHLRAEPDRYIYAAMRKGVEQSLPAEIEKGVDTKAPLLLERRAGWNKPARAEYALPTEIWREVVARRQRYAEVRDTLVTRHSTLDTNSLITLNLDICQFAQDVIDRCDGPDLLRALWQAVSTVTVLDPTCGSGAFLFATVNILEPLYEACLDRMEDLLQAETAQIDPAKRKATARGVPLLPHKKFEDFSLLLDRIAGHPNPRYFILKSIILNNLYGVDIMPEAVEICKLRLFLKLVAQVEPDTAKPNLGIEPLPDIDFNIRAGNTLVGFATEKQAEDVIRQDLLAYNTVWPEVQRDAREIAELFGLFRQQQTEIGGAVSAEDKARLRKKLAPLEDRLNTYLAETYGVTKKSGLKDWVHSHKPFHWFIEFYEIMANAGFDVTIGNPPYVEFTPSKVDYQIRGFETEECGNLYAYIMERSLSLLQSGGRSGLIVLIGSMCTERMAPLQNLHAHQCERLWLSTYSGHTCPSVLFDGVANRFAIWLSERGTALSDIYTSKYLKWYADERPDLFPLIHYHPSRPFAEATTPKLGALPAASILAKILRQTRPLGNYMAGSDHLYVYTTPIHWMKAYDFRPYFKCGDKTLSTQFKPMSVSEEHKIEISGVLNSSLFFVWWIMRSDCYHLVSREIDRFPFDAGSLRDDIRKDIRRLSVLLTKDIQKKSFIGTRNQKTTGLVRFQVTDPKLSKPIIDEIDQVLAKHYGFTDAELDFIINYDIKYRMGRNGGEEE